MKDQDLVYGSSALLSVNQFSMTGMAFAGWSLEENGAVAFDNGESVLNLTETDDDVVDLYAVWEKITVAAPQIMTSAGALSFIDQAEVTISCATEGALIYYSTTGTTPRTTDSFLYIHPFAIADTTTVKAVAVKNGVKSEYVTVTITKKSMSLDEAVGADGLTFVTGGDAVWSPVTDFSDEGDGYSARSGHMVCPARGTVSSWMELMLDGPGELSFRWKVSCEEDDSGACDWDRLMYYVDDAYEDADRIDGSTDWEQKTVEFKSLGTHKIRWVYLKDNYDEEGMTGEDCGWVDCVVWRPGVDIPSDVTGGAEFRVMPEWAAKYAQFQSKFGADLAVAMTRPTGKISVNGAPMQVWHDYVAGTDPTDPNDLFKAVLEMVDGKPVISWQPDLNKSKAERTYKIYGRRSLSDLDAWEHPANAAEHQFFKVDVSMPDNDDGGSDAPGVIEAWRLIALPTAISGLMYDGTTKQGVLPGLGYTLSNASATSAGNYVASAVLEGGCKWANGSQANQQIPWSIAKANNAWLTEPSMSAPTFQHGSAVMVTDGISKFGTVTRNYSDNEIKSLAAGSYTLVSTVSATVNYTGLTHSIPFTVTAPATKIALPSAKTGLIYTGSTQTGVATGTGYTLSGNTGVNAGTYTATATLKSGYEWSDGVSSQSRTISWSIAKATNSWLTQPSLSSTEFAKGSVVSIKLGAAKFGVCQANYTTAELAGLSVGSYTLTVSVAGTSNYEGLKKQIPFVVTKPSNQLDDVLTTSGLAFTTGGDKTWQSQADVSHDGNGAAQSGSISHGQNSWIQTTVSGPCEFSFWWKVSSESSYDKLHWYLDGVEQGSAISGEKDWAKVSVAIESGSHTVKWAYTKDGSVSSGSDCGWIDQIEVNKGEVQPDSLYCVIDLSGGPTAVQYPVTYLTEVPKGGWTDEYKTTKLVLRRISPGSFMMAGVCNVTLTEPYYIGVFELTQKQYELIVGSLHICAYYGDARPVQYMTWDEVRGDRAEFDWPLVRGVSESSIVGMLGRKTGLEFDLPTEAQWEYASRAGTVTAYNNGDNTPANITMIARCESNRNDISGGYTYGTAKVGSYLPNDWGLYDMHGNVNEMCLDRSIASYGTNDDLPPVAINPEGALSGKKQRVSRGGSYQDDPTKYDFLSNDYRWSGVLGYPEDGCRLILRVR